MTKQPYDRSAAMKARWVEQRAATALSAQREAARIARLSQPGPICGFISRMFR